MSKIANVSNGARGLHPVTSRLPVDGPGLQQARPSRNRDMGFSGISGNFSSAKALDIHGHLWKQPSARGAGWLSVASRTVRFSYTGSGMLSGFELVLPSEGALTLQLACALSRLALRCRVRETPAPAGYAGLTCSVEREDGTELNASDSALLKAAILVFVAHGATMDLTRSDDLPPPPARAAASHRAPGAS